MPLYPLNLCIYYFCGSLIEPQCFDEPEDDPCAGVECKEGEICIDGECVGDPCAGVMCDEGYIAKVVDGSCDCVADPCYGVVCPPGFTCVNGVCVPDKPVITPETPVVRVVDCVGKIDPGGSGDGNNGGNRQGIPGPGGKAPYRRPKREVCN